MSDWDDIATPSLEEFLAEEAKDSNFFWRIDSGHHQNLLDDATTRIGDALKLHAPHCVTCGVDNCQTRRVLSTQYGEVKEE
jgi:hypothetical protein